MPALSPLASLVLSTPVGDITHLELRFDDPRTRWPSAEPTAPGVAGGSVPTRATPPADPDVGLDGVPLARVKTLDVVMRGRDLVPATAMRVARLIERLPELRALTVHLAGPPDPRNISLAAGLRDGCVHRRVTYAVNLVLGGSADALDALGQDPTTPSPPSLGLVLEASRRLRVDGVTVRWIVPLVPALVNRLEALFSLARDEGVDPVLTSAWSRSPDGGRPAAALEDEDRLFVSDFVTYRLLDEEIDLHSRGRIASYRALDHAVRRGSTFPSTGARTVAVLHAGDTEHESRWRLAYEERPTVGGAAEARKAPLLQRLEHTRAGRRLAQAIGVGGVLLDGGYALAQWIRAFVVDRARTHRPGTAGRFFARALLIGAYGGEHIGDAAILGGVLCRLARRHGTTEAVVMSQRPAHTRHLIRMLDPPCTVEVEAYEHSRIRERVPAVDAVVFAGGPLIDLPKQLVKHLYTASLARRFDRPFILEGIGPGPFPRRLSEWTARRIIRLAERITVRTSADADSRLLEGLRFEVDRDPAFDYLAARGGELTRLREQDRQWIERLLACTEGSVLVGVNLRPIRHLFTVGVSRRRRAAYTRTAEARFEERLAEGMRRFRQASPAPPCFIFFPMNAIQFGMSDLRSAYRLKRLLRGDVDLRVWEADASLDGVVALLRRVDIVIAMRFHAAIFALAQQRRVIGIDYRVGARDKVAALLGDFGHSENCCRIDELTADWLLQRLLALAVPLPGAPAPGT